MAIKFKRVLLEVVAAEMNKVMKLTPPITADMMDDEVLLENIRHQAVGGKNVKDAIRATDEFTEETWRFFVELGVWDAEKKALVCAKATKAEKPDDAKGAADFSLTAEDEIKKEERKVNAQPSKKMQIAKNATSIKKAAPVKKAIVKATLTKKAAPVKKGIPAKKTTIAKKVGSGIGVYVRERLTKDKKIGNKELAAEVVAKFKSKTTSACIAYYRNQLKQKAT